MKIALSLSVKIQHPAKQTLELGPESYWHIAGNNHIYGQRNLIMHACSYSDPGISEKTKETKVFIWPSWTEANEN